VAPVVQRRLDVLGPEATALARAAVVLGDRHRLDELGAIAGLSPDDAAAAADRLVAADLLAPGSWDFVHPVVREAVAETLAPAERNRLHALAARRLTEGGARPEEVAVHLVQTEPAGDPSVVATLRAAARGAAAEAAPEAAIAQLRRALAEPPAPAEAPAVLLELGELEARAQEPADAIAHLGEALELGLDGDDAARALSTQGALTLLTEPAPALPMFERALAVATDPALRLRLESLLLEALTFTDAGLARRHELLDAARVDPDASPVALAALAHESGWSAAPVAETLAFLRRATSTDLLLDVVGPGNSTYNLLIHAARYAEAPDVARHLLEQGERAAQRTATRQAALFLEHAWGYWHLFFGSVAAGRAQAETGLARTREAGYGIVGGALAAILCELLVEQDDLDEAARVVEDVDPAAEETIVGPFLLASRGQIRWRQRRIEEAEADLRRSIDQLDRRGWVGPLVSSSRLRLAELLGERGERDEAVDRARTCAEVARRAGTPGAHGASLRVAGLNLGGDEGIAVLEQAVAELGPSTLTLEHGWALHDLGAALRRAGRRADARGPLREALEVAGRAEAPWLARQARDELAATGARVQRESLRGPAALTPSERRVVELAAQGLRNREIAETLWVTRKTVEVHLGNAYGKLGIRSRAQLADALAPLAEAPAA
jgi:DNA-binding CsgD family transcriptional regulator